MATTAKPAAAPAPAAAQPGLAPCEYKTGKTLGHGSYATVKEAVQVGFKTETSPKYHVHPISVLESRLQSRLYWGLADGLFLFVNNFLEPTADSGRFPGSVIHVTGDIPRRSKRENGMRSRSFPNSSCGARRR
jgi:hypothetical protein